MKKTYVIAELGLNHNGDINIAMKMVDSAIRSGADAIKLQKRDVNQMATSDILNKPFTSFPSFGKTYRAFREYLELNLDEYKKIRSYCENKIDFIVTPFDIQSLEFIDELNVDAIKIASHSMTDIPLLEEISFRKKPIYISTGMCSIKEIETAMNILDPLGNRKDITILHCVSNYPTDPDCFNLPMIGILKSNFPNCDIGVSDHQDGISLVPASIALGAKVIEKHFTLDKNMEGPDHSMSIEPHQLEECIKNIRITESAMIYHKKDGPMQCEMNCYNDFRRSIVARVDIPKGTILKRNMLTTKAPNRGLAPYLISEIIGKKVTKDVNMDEHITFDKVEL